VGGVILYGENIASPSQVAALVAQLQSAAQAGGNPRLLISTDQEGGLVRRLPWAAPDLSAQEMGAQGAGTAGNEGRATGEALRAVGINVNLAPDADVAHTTSAFIWQQRRSFGTDSVTVRDSTTAFATGLEGAGVAPAAKHFPGLGSALTDTDYAMQRVRMRPDDLIPFEALITQQIPLIMVSTAVYTNLDPSNPAALSPAVISGLLRQQLQYQGVVMTDDLERPTGGSTADAAVRADQAGADIILVSTSESGGAVAYNALLQAAQAGQISQARIAEAYSRITLLKQRYAGS
jgi:beta-N-acetylhexosaminidase